MQNPSMSSQDQSQDTHAGTDEPEEERIAELTEHIDKARSQAEEAGVLVDTDEEHYADSGATGPEDDQTITPPG